LGLGIEYSLEVGPFQCGHFSAEAEGANYYSTTTNYYSTTHLKLAHFSAEAESAKLRHYQHVTYNKLPKVSALVYLL
jgi:hypothetical protein